MHSDISPRIRASVLDTTPKELFNYLVSKLLTWILVVSPKVVIFSCLMMVCFLNHFLDAGCNGEQLERVLDFAFLEPEDDPRHFCYLTVVAQTATGLRTPFAVVYSLTYVHKDASPDGVIVYEDLQYITLRLDLNFGPLIVSKISSEPFPLLRL